MNWEYAILEFEKRQKEVLQHSTNTVKTYHNNLAIFSQSMIELGIDDPVDVTREHIETFFNSRANEYQNSSQNQMLTTLKQFYKDYQVFHKLDNGNPTEFIQSNKLVKHLPVFLTENEVKQFLNLEIDEESIDLLLHKAIFELLYCGGLRVSEVCNLQLNNLHLSQNIIRFIGKGSKERFVLLHKDAVDAIDNYLKILRPKYLKNKNSSFVFITAKGKQITRQSVYYLVNERAKQVGIYKNVTPHSLRHSYASHMLDKGADLVSIQELLGHSDIRTTEIYTHLEVNKIRSVYDSVFPRAKKNDE